MKMSALAIKASLTMLLCLNSVVAWASEIAQEDNDQKAVVIIFNPPEGKEKEFLEHFVQKQKSHLLESVKSRKKPSSGINLIPVKVGDPLIHIVIYADTARFEEAYKKFGARENRAEYLNRHAQKYGIPKFYLQDSKFYVADVVN